MLEEEPDFKKQKPLIVEAVEAAGGRVLFGTKFHPELMTIENAYRLVNHLVKNIGKIVCLCYFLWLRVRHVHSMTVRHLLDSSSPWQTRPYHVLYRMKFKCDLSSLFQIKSYFIFVCILISLLLPGTYQLT